MILNRVLGVQYSIIVIRIPVQVLADVRCDAGGSGVEKLQEITNNKLPRG